MVRYYKQLQSCGMCKKRFTVEGDNYQNKFYCPECYEKYFRNKKNVEEKSTSSDK